MSRTTQEIHFINKIDCKFPYANAHAAEQLIQEAIAISPNAVFKLVEELVRVPESKRKEISIETLCQLLEQTLSKYQHPLVDPICQIGQLLIKEQKTAQSDILSILLKIKNFPGQYAALSIACDASPSSKVDNLYQEIIYFWESKGDAN